VSSAVIKGTNSSLKRTAHSTNCADATKTINRPAQAAATAAAASASGRVGLRFAFARRLREVRMSTDYYGVSAVKVGVVRCDPIFEFE
jgi:hypothetical protein